MVERTAACLPQLSAPGRIEFSLAKIPIVIGHYRSVPPTLQGVPARPAILAFALAAGALLSYQLSGFGWLTIAFVPHGSR